MRRLLLLTATIVALSGLVVWSAPSAYACSCKESPPGQAIAGADAIFEGTVSDKTRGPRGYTYTFLVERSYKGEVAETALVETGFGGGDCGFEYGVGDRALVFGSGRGLTLSSSICASLGTEQADVERVLGPGTEVAPGGRGGDILPDVDTAPLVDLSTLAYAAVATLLPWLGLFVRGFLGF